MTKRVVLMALVSLIGLFGLPGRASASSYNLATLIPNAGFESGLAGWTYTGAGVNVNTYLTGTEWSTEFWASSSPFPGYTDAFLAANYPGQPWGLNPDITHVQQTGGAVDPGGVISAPVGNNFVGSRQDGYEGHYLTGGAPSTPTSYYDTNFQLTISLAAAFLNGDQFSLETWANRGMLRSDFGSSNTTSTLNFRLIGDAVGPDFNQVCTFSSWAVDGAWASQPCNWTLDRNVSALTLIVTGQNSNHDRYVAVDMGGNTTSAVPEPSSMVLLGSGLVGLAAAANRRRLASKNR